MSRAKRQIPTPEAAPPTLPQNQFFANVSHFNPGHLHPTYRPNPAPQQISAAPQAPRELLRGSAAPQQLPSSSSGAPQLLGGSSGAAQELLRSSSTPPQLLSCSSRAPLGAPQLLGSSAAAAWEPRSSCAAPQETLRSSAAPHRWKTDGTSEGNRAFLLATTTHPTTHPWRCPGLKCETFAKTGVQIQLRLPACLLQQPYPPNHTWRCPGLKCETFAKKRKSIASHQQIFKQTNPTTKACAPSRPGGMRGAFESAHPKGRGVLDSCSDFCQILQISA